MSDLIERSEAVEAVNRALDKETILQRFVRKIAIDAIKEMPSAQPERKKGHWEDVPHKSVEHGEVIVDGKTVRCSVCRRAEKGWNKGMNYCPECGAKMEVEHEA